MEFLDFKDTEAVYQYNRFVQKSSGSFMQSTLWCGVKADWLHEAVISRGSTGEIRGCILVLIKNFPPPLKSFLYAPRGPVWDYKDPGVLRDLLSGVEALAKKHKAYAFKTDPIIEAEDKRKIAVLCSAGLAFHPGQEDALTIQSRNNYILEIAGRDEAALLAAVKPKCRYNLHVAEKKGVTCTVCGKERLGDFHRLMAETGKRDGFHIRSEAYFARMLDALGKHCRLYMCDFEGQALSGAICVQYGGRTCYVYGASTAEHRDAMPNYLMQWEMIRWALDAGCQVYDFQGVPCWYDPNNPNYGVYRFKSGFNGRLSIYAGEFRMVFSPGYKRLFDKALTRIGYQKFV